MAGGRCGATCTRSAAKVHGVKVIISGRSAPTPQIHPLQIQVTGDPCQTFDWILLVGWLVGWPHSIGQREGMGYVFDYAIYHQNSHSFGAICKWANGYLTGLNLLKFVTFCCLLFVVVGFVFLYTAVCDPCQTFDWIFVVSWVVGWPHSKGGVLESG